MKNVIYDITNFESINFESINEYKGETQAFLMNHFYSTCDNMYFQNITNLLLYLSSEQYKAKNKFNKTSYVNIECFDMREKLINFNVNSTIEKVVLKYNAVEMLYKNESLESSEFINYLKNIDEIYFEINILSSEYQQIYERIIKLKETILDKIKIKVLISGINYNDQFFRNNNFINSIEIDAPLAFDSDILFQSITYLEEIIV